MPASSSTPSTRRSSCTTRPAPWSPPAALTDGKNEFIQYTPLTTGLYRIRVVGEATTNGEYFLGTNFLPVAQNDSPSTAEDTAVAINVLTNDSDVDGTLNPATVTIVSGPANGSATVDPATGSSLTRRTPTTTGPTASPTP